MNLETIQKTCNSLIKSLEIFYVFHDYKPTSRIMVHDAKVEEYKQLMDKLNLQCTLSDFKIQKQQSVDYSDKGTISTTNKPGYRFMYVAKHHPSIHRLKTLEQQQNHKELGIALGYPECCCSFFEQHFKEQSKKSNDYTLLTLENSKPPFPFQTNIAARHFDHALVSHFPCSFNCKHSIEIANNNRTLLKEKEPKILEEIEKDLKSAVIYDEPQGIFLLYNAKEQEKKIHYNGLKGTKTGKRYQELKDSNETEKAILFQ
ncbi:MAG: hypothetical protein O2779_03275 [Nanoarchaeota archaeon]|nr:hypothetical protein [Nanoarchaeota archaeon]